MTNEPIAVNDTETAFHDRLFRHVSVGPETDLPPIAAAWLIPTQASWVWMWLRNNISDTAQWELVATASKTDVVPIPPQKTFDAGTCIGDLCLAREEPIVGVTPDAIFSHGGIVYKPAFKDWFIENDCGRIDVIPLISGTGGTSHACRPALPVDVIGMVALHHRKDAAKLEQPAAE